jgi:hypothetical protein
MKTLILKILPLLFVIVWPVLIKSQTIVTTAESVTSCPGEIQIPVRVTNCNGIGAISLKLNFDTTKLTYIGYQNLNTALNGGMILINSSSNKVFISWINTTAANLGDSIIVKLRFNAISGTSNLSWDLQTSGNCEYSNINGNVLTATFTDGTVTINQPPIINTQPVDKTVLLGLNTSFSIAATGTGINYLWQISTDAGNSWIDLVNNANYSGVTSASLSITNALLSFNNYKYRCRLTGICTPIVYTNEVTLTVINPVTTTLPTASYCPGIITVPVIVNNFTGIAAFSLVFSYNTSCLTYSGYQSTNTALSAGNLLINANGGKLYMTWSSANSTSFVNDTMVKLLFTAVSGSSSLTWDNATAGSCEYSGINDMQITTVFVNGSETIYSIPAVTSQAVNKTIAKGQNTTFSIATSGTGLSHLWQVSTNGGVSFSDLTNSGYYSNVTTTTLTITSAQLAINAYQYRCKVSGSCSPIVYSNPVTLTILPNIITNCPTLTQCPGQVIVPITVTDFIAVASFSLTLNVNSSVLSYNSYQNLNASVANGFLNINAVGNKVYLTWSNSSAATIANGAVLLELKFTGVPGSSALSWDTPITGNCEYSDINGQLIFSSWNNGNVTINSPPAITANPVNSSIYATGSTSFSVTASGTSPGYQWQVSTNGGSSFTNLSNVVPYSGINAATLTINPTSNGMNGYLYKCIVTGSCTPSDTSNSGQLTVTSAPITTTPGTVSSSCTGNLNIPINVTNCNNVGSISLTMIYDTSKMSFEGYNSVNNALSGGMLVVNRTGNRIIMSWASSTAANIGSGILIQYRFIAISGISTILSWDNPTAGACEYTDLNGNIITSFYNNSNISVIANTLNVNAGSDICIVSGGSAQLTGSVTGGTAPYTYLWTPSTGLSNPAIPNPIASPTSTTNYTLTITGNNACTAYDQMIVSVNNFAGTAGNISGSSVVTQGQNNVSYTVPSVANATSYIWTLPTGASIVSGSNTNSILVNFSNTALSGNINVYGSNSCGNGSLSPDFPVTVNLLPCSPPSNQASLFTVAAITKNSMTIGWTRGNGDSVLVIARQGSVVNADPVNGIKYNANSAFNNGTQLGTGNYVVYKGTGTSVNITALTSETTYYFAVYEYNRINTCYKIPGLLGSGLTSSPNSTFTAAISNAWETIANWDNGVPDSTTNAIIPANKLAVINSNNNKCMNLTIAALGKLTINTSKDLFALGTLTMQSDATGNASLINNGTLTSSANIIQRYIPVSTQDEFHQLSSPVMAQAISPNFSPVNQSFYAWKESNASWLAFEDDGFNALNGSNNFNPGKGYAVSYLTTSTKSFNGLLNNGIINTALSVTAGIYAGWNFIGNPYPSAINWNTAAGYSRNMLEDAGTVTNEYAFWIWNPTIGNYGTFISSTLSGTNGVSNMIAPTQGFWVKATTAGIFSINNNAREHAAQPWLKSILADNNTLRLKITSTENSFSDEMMICFGNTNDFGGAEKMSSLYQNAPEIFSTKLNKSWSINNLTSVSQNEEVTVGFKPGVDGNFTISASGVQFFGNVILYDLKTGIHHNLSIQNNYSFDALTTDNQNRFLLNFSPKVINDESEMPTLYYYNKSISIYNPWFENTDIYIYNEVGRLIDNFRVNNGNSNYTINFTQGMYTVKMKNEKHIFVKKLIIY